LCLFCRFPKKNQNFSKIFALIFNYLRKYFQKHDFCHSFWHLQHLILCQQIGRTGDVNTPNIINKLKFNTMKTTVSLHSLMILGSKERKSLSGAIKTSKATSTAFWNRINDKIKRDQVDPAWIVEHATDKQRNDKQGNKREHWSAWLVEQIVANHYKSLQ
jgi:hypothetical protein